MKIRCNREQLLKVFQAVASVVPAKSNKEVLANVKFVAEGDTLVLHGTDLDVWMIAPVSGVEVERPGKALLPVGRMAQMLQEIPDEFVTIDAQDTQIVVKGPHSEFKLPTANPDEYPSVKPFEAQSYHSITARVFAEAMKRTLFATDPDSSRFALGGVLVELEGKDCVMVGTDGRRLACVKFGGESVCEHSTHGSSVVPLRAGKVIQRALDGGTTECKVSITANDISVEFNGLVIGSRLVEGRYPNWKQVIPSRNQEDWNRVELAAGPLSAVVRQASIVADSETRGLDFAFTKGNLIVGAQTQELGQSTIEMPIEWEDETLKIKLDFRFVREFLSMLLPGEKLYLEIARSTMPAVLSVEGYTYVIMPMAID